MACKWPPINYFCNYRKRKMLLLMAKNIAIDIESSYGAFVFVGWYLECCVNCVFLCVVFFICLFYSKYFLVLIWFVEHEDP